MRDLVTSLEFWAAMILAAALKLRASPRLTIWGAVTTIATAVLSALIFTEPLLDRLGLSGETYTAAVAALVALTAEQIARQILDLKVYELIRAWRGK